MRVKMKMSLVIALLVVTALSPYELEATTIPVELAQNVGKLNSSAPWVRVHPQDPVTVACTSPCGQVSWDIVPSGAFQNVTLLSRTDHRCSSTTGTCIIDFTEPCPAAENEYMRFTLTFKTTTTILVHCDAYVTFTSDLTTRYMVRGDTMLVLVEEEPPPPQTVMPSPSISATECLQTSLLIITTTTTTSIAASSVPVSTSSCLTFASHAPTTSSDTTSSTTSFGARSISEKTSSLHPTNIMPTFGAKASLTVSPTDLATVTDPMSGSIQATLCSFNSYIIITLALAGLLIITLIILIVTCIYCRYTQQKLSLKPQDLLELENRDIDTKMVSLSHPSHSFDEENRTPSYRDLPILEYNDPSQPPTSTAV